MADANKKAIIKSELDDAISNFETNLGIYLLYNFNGFQSLIVGSREYGCDITFSIMSIGKHLVCYFKIDSTSLDNTIFDMIVNQQVPIINDSMGIYDFCYKINNLGIYEIFFGDFENKIVLGNINAVSEITYIVDGGDINYVKTEISGATFNVYFNEEIDSGYITFGENWNVGEPPQTAIIYNLTIQSLNHNPIW